MVRCGQNPWDLVAFVVSRRLCRLCWHTVLTCSVYRTLPIDTIDMRWLYRFKICIFMCWPGAQKFSYWTVRQKFFTTNGKNKSVFVCFRLFFFVSLPQTNPQVFQSKTLLNALDCPFCSKLHWFVFFGQCATELQIWHMLDLFAAKCFFSSIFVDCSTKFELHLVFILVWIIWLVDSRNIPGVPPIPRTFWFEKDLGRFRSKVEWMRKIDQTHWMITIYAGLVFLHHGLCCLFLMNIWIIFGSNSF